MDPELPSQPWGPHLHLKEVGETTPRLERQPFRGGLSTMRLQRGEHPASVLGSVSRGNSLGRSRGSGQRAFLEGQRSFRAPRLPHCGTAVRAAALTQTAGSHSPLPPTTHVTTGPLTNLSSPRFPHFQMGILIVSTSNSCELNELAF